MLLFEVVANAKEGAKELKQGQKDGRGSAGLHARVKEWVYAGGGVATRGTALSA